MFSSWFGSSTPAQPPVYPELPSPKTEEEYESAINKSLEIFKTIASETDGWSPLSFDQRGELGAGISAWSKAFADSPVHAAKAVGVVKATPAQVTQYLRENESKIDPDTLVWEQIREVTPTAKLFYSAHAAPFPVTSREMVWVQRIIDEPDGSQIRIGFGVNAPDVPVRENRVRAALHIAGWLIKPSESDPNCSTVTRVLKLDPKGSIPSFVVNMTLSKVATNIMTLREQIKA